MKYNFRYNFLLRINLLSLIPIIEIIISPYDIRFYDPSYTKDYLLFINSNEIVIFRKSINFAKISSLKRIFQNSFDYDNYCHISKLS